MKTQTLEYKDGDVRLLGHLAFDDATSARRPGVVLFPEGGGLGNHTKSRAERLAKLGYVALAADPYGEARAARSAAEAGELMAPLRDSPTKLRQRARAAVDALARVPMCDASRMAAIGFCFGGTTSLELARDGAPLKGVVSFHGVLSTAAPTKPGAVKAKVLVCAASEDVLVPAAQRNALEDELRQAGADWQLIVYGNAQHSFTNPDVDALKMKGFNYDKPADERSWAAMSAFFKEIFA